MAAAQRSSSGADTYIVHGEVHLADGIRPTFAKVAAAVTLTFAEIVPAMEQPYAESFVYNAVRKTIDLGQLEFLKSGNRQPVPVTTRFYSRWQKKFLFTETDDAARLAYLLSKVYWLSGCWARASRCGLPTQGRAVPEYHRGGAAAHGRRQGRRGAARRWMGSLPRPRPKLLERAAEYQAALEAALNFTKPQFNESMRSGHGNM